MSDAPQDSQNPPEILCERRGRLGLVTLNRPRALNALSLGMVRALRTALDDWAADPEVAAVAIRAAGGRAFCAGGDIRQLHDLGREGRHGEALTFWREEYVLNAFIAAYPKPYVALIDGLVLGGGVGVSLHGAVRVAGPGYALAMPEVGIGFFPDVGATYALPRLPGAAGMWLALTGDRVGPGDALALGLATHTAPADGFPAILERLEAGAPVADALSAGGSFAPEAPLSAARPVIDACFAQGSVEEILARLDAHDSDFATRAARTIRTRSPMSLRIAHEQMRRGGGLDFAEAMRTEYRIVSRIIRGHDFYEGVRAAVIDKDGAPRWEPARLEAVDPAAVAAHFADLGPEELSLAESKLG
jgi:enoyl-CoA hydratase